MVTKNGVVKELMYDGKGRQTLLGVNEKEGGGCSRILKEKAVTSI